MVSKEFIEKEWIKAYNALNPFLDVNGAYELRKLLCDLRNNEKFIFISDNVDYTCIIELDELKDDIPIFKYASDCFKIFGIFSKSQLSKLHFASVYDIIVYSCVSELKRDLSYNERKKIYYCNLIHKLTLNQDISSNFNQNFKYNNELFNQMKKIRWNSSANKLKNIIYRDLMGTLTLELNTDSGVTSSFGECAEYLACCNVFNDNRLEVMPDDVVKSWLLTLNLFLMDLRPYIKDFNSASDMIADTGSEFKPINISEGQSNNKSSSIIRKVLAGVLSIIIVFLLLIVMSTILILIFGDALDNFIGLLRPVGIIGLALAAALGKKIYYKLV